ncbi:cell division protein ZapA [Sphingomonas panaciterrae]|uniref:cell division protein ZapA n=1 Tax=Sphingomonas panaciterrae TaxID=1462999 RepID=UPI002FF23ACB
MARVSLDIGGTRWTVNTREGGEAEVQRLGRIVAERWPQALRAAGDGGIPQALLLTALMLADEVSEAQAQLANQATRLEAQSVQIEEQSALLDAQASQLEEQSALLDAQTAQFNDQAAQLATPSVPSDSAQAEAVDLDTLVAIAERLEGLAEALEQPAPND